MSSKLKRIASTYGLTVTNSLSTTEAISFADEAGMIIYTPAAWTSCTITVYSQDPVTGTYQALCDSAGDAVTMTAPASKSLTLSDAIFPAVYLKLVTDQSANNALTVGATSKG